MLGHWIPKCGSTPASPENLVAMQITDPNPGLGHPPPRGVGLAPHCSLAAAGFARGPLYESPTTLIFSFISVSTTLGFISLVVGKEGRVGRSGSQTYKREALEGTPGLRAEGAQVRAGPGQAGCVTAS